ncbi:MAG: hypothetical protein US36_C0002G0035 [Candidatus Wolfebacteria bacterium GW2011_GWC1_37_10]|uniref:POTRA domain-containing protein n=1 Tax=Candidatus Wolfebacteria bacterium GW2011_GWC1_37_10 TaxID=1619010 RepID=A0A0G0GB71_9BACT|nr:MAG: hypothetical protein US36_C0002G0035 [Candidatus Wolfebacteria bacterium GW2011_GWC1_37_10]
MEIIAEKQRKRKRLAFKFKAYSTIIFFSLLIVFALYLLIQTNIFKIKNIEVVQLNINQSETQKIIGKYKIFLAGQSKIKAILGTDNILVWENSEEFLKSQPHISEFSIEKDYLNREIKIKISDREKFGIWCLSGQNPSNCWWFDKHGLIFEKAPLVEGEMIYKINDFSGRDLKIGDLAISGYLFQNLSKIFGVLEKLEINIRTFQLSELSSQEISTESALYPKIYFSLRIDPNLSIATLQSLKKTGWNKIEYIDLRVENRAFYKLK